MTRIAVFCDGTWNAPDNVEPTHVVELSRALVNDPGAGQVVAYFAEIGTDRRFDGAFARFVNRWGGGAFGWGLDTKVKQAYQFLCLACQRGDEIYLFGFSRGAFTARSVAGMIRKCGLIDDPTEARVNEAFELYRLRGHKNRPDAPHIQARRAAMSPRFATSDADLAARGAGASLVQLAYVGVWDTVGARGIPPSFLGPVATLWNRQYRFHDMALSRLVRRARHAVGLDERRVLYQPALWSNLGSLNGGARGNARPYQQLWFFGNHGIIGGSAGAAALSAFTLEWIFEGARELTLKPGINVPGVSGDAAAESHALANQGGLLARWRKGPVEDADLHPSVHARIEARRDYRPGSLFTGGTLPHPAPRGPDR